MNKILLQLLIWIVCAVLAGIGGTCIGPPKIHYSGDANYVPGSHCFVRAEVSDKKFSEMLDWCEKLHHAD